AETRCSRRCRLPADWPSLSSKCLVGRLFLPRLVALGELALSSTLQRCQATVIETRSRQADAVLLLTHGGGSPKKRENDRFDDLFHHLGGRGPGEERGRATERVGQSFADPQQARQRSHLDDDRAVQLLYLHGAARWLSQRPADQGGTQAGHPQIDAGLGPTIGFTPCRLANKRPRGGQSLPLAGRP